VEALGDAADDLDAEINTIVLSSPDAMQVVRALQQRNGVPLLAGGAVQRREYALVYRPRLLN
jgi:hypothetical protein